MELPRRGAAALLAPTSEPTSFPCLELPEDGATVAKNSPAGNFEVEGLGGGQSNHGPCPSGGGGGGKGAGGGIGKFAKIPKPAFPTVVLLPLFADCAAGIDAAPGVALADEGREWAVAGDGVTGKVSGSS